MDNQNELVIKICCEECYHVNEFIIPHNIVHAPTPQELREAAKERYKEVNSQEPPNAFAMQTTTDTFATVTRLFYDLGLQPNLLGFVYSREAICMVVEDQKIMVLGVTKKLYPAIAEKYFTTGSRVERAIRHSIEHLFKYGNKQKLDRYFNFGFRQASKPTNGEFIALLADMIRTGQIM